MDPSSATFFNVCDAAIVRADLAVTPPELPRGLKSDPSTAVVVIPHERHWALFDAVRRPHDKAFGRWPPHVTIQWPSVPADHLAELIPHVAHIAADSAPIAVNLRHLGTFSSRGRVTAHLTPAELPCSAGALARLAHRIAAASRLPPTGRPFAAHLTLGQFDTPAAAAAAWGATAVPAVVFGHVCVLRNGGPGTPYRTIAAAPLGGGAHSVTQELTPADCAPRPPSTAAAVPLPPPPAPVPNGESAAPRAAGGSSCPPASSSMWPKGATYFNVCDGAIFRERAGAPPPADMPAGVAPDHGTAVVLLPHERHWHIFDTVRETHDKAYGRWPPHVLLHWPSVPGSRLGDFVPHVARIAADTEPLAAHLRTPRAVARGRGVVGAVDVEELPCSRGAVERLAARIAAAANLPPTGREFKAQLTIGQFDSAAAVTDAWTAAVEAAGGAAAVGAAHVFSFVYVLRNAGPGTPFRVAAALPLRSAVNVTHEMNVAECTVGPAWRAEVEALRARQSLADAPALTAALAAGGASLRGVRVGGVDITFDKDAPPEGPADGCAALVVVDAETLEVLHSDLRAVRTEVPYVSGYLAFREVPALLPLLLACPPDKAPHLLLVDGSGVLHPRGFGLACHLGITAGVPCAGVAKTFLACDGLSAADVPRLKAALHKAGDHVPLVGTSGRTWGAALRATADAPNPLFVSAGHGVTLDTAVRVAAAVSKFRVPEPIRQADVRSREWMREHGFNRTAAAAAAAPKRGGGGAKAKHSGGGGDAGSASD